MQLVEYLTPSHRRIRENRSDNFRPATIRPDEHRAVLAAAAERVGPDINRLSFQLELLEPVAVAVDFVLFRMTEMQCQQLSGNLRLIWNSGFGLIPLDGHCAA